MVPIYKGNGKNPVLTNSYRGIPLTSTIGKVFERIILPRITLLLEERGIPHNQLTKQGSYAQIRLKQSKNTVSGVVYGGILCLS